MKAVKMYKLSATRSIRTRDIMYMGRKRVVGGINKAPFSQGYGFSSTHVWMQELEYKES